MIDYGGVGVVQPYMNTCGGITEAKRIVEMAQSRGALVIPGNWSTQINGAAAVHLSLLDHLHDGGISLPSSIRVGARAWGVAD